MNRLNEKYGRITFGFLLLSMISFPPMTIYLLYKIVRNTNIDTQDNYLSITKCAKCFVCIPTIFLIMGLLFDNSQKANNNWQKRKV